MSNTTRQSNRIGETGHQPPTKYKNKHCLPLTTPPLAPSRKVAWYIARRASSTASSIDMSQLNLKTQPTTTTLQMMNPSYHPMNFVKTIFILHLLEMHAHSDIKYQYHKRPCRPKTRQHVFFRHLKNVTRQNVQFSILHRNILPCVQYTICISRSRPNRKACALHPATFTVHIV